MDRREELIERIRHDTEFMSNHIRNYEKDERLSYLKSCYFFLKNAELNIRKLMDEYE